MESPSSTEIVCLGAVLISTVAVVTMAYLMETVVPSEFSFNDYALADEIALPSGTLLFFESSPEINVVLGTRWSHVAFVVEWNGVPYCVDITPTSRTVAIRRAHDVIRESLDNGLHRMAVRQLVARVDPSEALHAFVNDCILRDARYEHVYWRSAFGRILQVLRLEPARHPGIFFCSSLVAAALRSAGVLVRSVDVAAVLPHELASPSIPTMPGYSYAPLTLLRTRSAAAAAGGGGGEAATTKS